LQALRHWPLLCSLELPVSPAAFVIFGVVLPVFPAVPGSTVFTLAFVGVAEASEDDATAGSACGCKSAAGFEGCWLYLSSQRMPVPVFPPASME